MLSPPDLDEIEVSFFGPGYGECALIHVMNNEWIIVDSCIDPMTKNPAALQYLQQIGVNPEDAVKLVVASHWHDDHIRGLSQIYEACRSAEFVMSDALTAKEFLVLSECIGANSMIEGGAGIEEFHKIFQIINESSKKTTSRQYKPPITASENQCIWASSYETSRVTSLSPSSHSKIQSFREIATLLPKVNEPKKWLVPSLPNANHVAVVLWVEVADVTILLGADLEEVGHPCKGWSAIVNSNKRPKGKAHIFKIPHHGSETGDLPNVWGEMLVEDPIAVCSPYSRGKSLPTKSDITRISSRTENAYITSTVKMKVNSVSRDSAVKKTIDEAGIKFLPRIYQPGMVRYRTRQKPEVQLFKGATHLNGFPAS